MFSPTFDPLTKVVVSYHLGKRPAENARALPTDLRGRILNQPQITTDGFNAYVDAVDEVFGSEVDYAALVKDDGFRKRVHQGAPDLELVSTLLLERCNLTVRMQLKRHARRANAHSKTLEHHRAAVALHFAFYHFCRVHETLQVTPAMELGVTALGPARQVPHLVVFLQGQGRETCRDQPRSQGPVCYRRQRAESGQSRPHYCSAY